MTAIRLTGAMAIAAMLIAGVATAQQAQPAPQAQPQPQARPAPVTPALAPLPATQALFDGYVRDGRLPGIVGAFGVGDFPTLFVNAGRIATDPAAGTADPGSLWRVYSMTKPVTGIATMLLVQDGKLSLDDPLSKFFPAFAKMRVATSPDTSLDTRPAKGVITIRQLLTHTSGLGYQISAKGPLLKEYERLGLVPFAVNAATEAVARRARPATLAQFAERTAQVPLVADPGTVWHYSMGLDVLGAVIEKASGMSFEAFVRTRLLDPLKMNSTDWQVAPGDVARFATNYTFAGATSMLGGAMVGASGAAAGADTLIPVDPAATSPFLRAPSFAYGGAGLVSSARDYDRFLHMLQDEGTLDGVRVMTPETARLAMSNLMPAGVFFPGMGDGSEKMGFGAGGMVYLADSPTGAKKGTYGWGGAAGTIAIVDPARRFRATIMINYFAGAKWSLREEAFGAVARDLAALQARMPAGARR